MSGLSKILGHAEAQPLDTGPKADVNANYDVIVVGAGHNGLACAAFLAKAGKDVLLLEGSDVLGGACQTGPILDDRFSASRCAHIVRHLHPKVVRGLRLHRHGLSYASRHLQTVALDEDGRHITFGKNAWVAGGNLVRHCERDAEIYVEFQRRMMRYAHLIHQAQSGPPPRLGKSNEPGHAGDGEALLKRLSRIKKKLRKGEAEELSKFLVANVRDILDAEFETDLLKGALAFDAVLGRNAGPTTPGTAFHLVSQWSGEVAGLTGGLAIPKGGMGELTQALIKAFTHYGGTIRTGRKVARIVTQGQRAIGIELAKGARIFASQIVTAIDSRSALLDLVGSDRLDTELVRDLARDTPKGTAAKLNLGLDGLPEVKGYGKEPLPDARYIVAPNLDYIEAAFTPSKYNQPADEPIMEITFPSLSDPSLAPEGQHVVSIIAQYAPYDIEGGWQDKRDSFIQSCAQVLSRYFPDFQNRIIGGELLAPPDLEREFNLAGGHWHHTDPGLDRQMMLRPAAGVAQYKGPFTGLYLCGAGVHPGGGINGISGHNAAKAALADWTSLRQSFKQELPQSPDQEGDV